MALWGGRFTQEADARFKAFNDSLVFDYRMAMQDIEGSIGWAKAIASVGVITNEELNSLTKALNELLIEVSNDPHAIAKSGHEDIHSFVESKLIAKVGDSFQVMPTHNMQSISTLLSIIRDNKKRNS